MRARDSSECEVFLLVALAIPVAQNLSFPTILETVIPFA